MPGKAMLDRRLDRERAASMADEGGRAAAALVETQAPKAARGFLSLWPVRVALGVLGAVAIIGGLVFAPRFWRRAH